jgi:hypothetical protein
MSDIDWYAEASLASGGHVFCAGSLAQCVRKWTRLPEVKRAAAQIRLTGRYEAIEIVEGDQIARLARNPELAMV